MGVFNEKHDMNEYKKLADTFTAKDFDVEEIARAAKETGCKYITLTTMDHGSILINLSGRGDKDMDFVIENYGIR